MTPDLDKRLRSAWPLVFPKPLLNDEPIRCGDGWFMLLWELCHDLEVLISGEAESQRDQYRAVQVKEKFGTLRFYLDKAGTQAMQALIDDAEKTSARVCDVCGKPGALRSGNPDVPMCWVRTRCDEHIDWREGKTGFAHASEPKT
jgi:hypothetical protein